MGVLLTDLNKKYIKFNFGRSMENIGIGREAFSWYIPSSVKWGHHTFPPGKKGMECSVGGGGGSGEKK